MEDSNADTIMDNINFLSQKTRGLYKIMTLLIDKGVLTNRDRRSIMLLPDSYTKSYDLYTQMADKGEKACIALMEAWISSGNEELTKKIINDNANREFTSLNEDKETVYHLAGERNEYLQLKEFPESILSISEKLTEIDFSWVEIDAYTFPRVLEEFTSLRKLKLSHAKINGFFSTKIFLENLKEFYLTVVDGKVNYQNKTDSIQFLIFVDTLAMPDPHKNYWEMSRLWKQRCDITVGFDGKFLLKSCPNKNSFTSSLSNSHMFLDQIDSKLEKLALSRLKLDSHYINIHNKLTDLILHQFEGNSNSVNALIQNCKELKTLKLVAKKQVTINTCHIPSLLTNLSLGNVNLSYNKGDSFDLETLALDFCVLSDDLKDDFHKIFQCRNMFVGGIGYLFEPDNRLLRSALKIGSKLQWICMAGFNDLENHDIDSLASNNNKFSTREFLDLLGIPQRTQTFTMEILNDSWKGQICCEETLRLYKYEWFGLEYFWEKDAYSCLK